MIFLRRIEPQNAFNRHKDLHLHIAHTTLSPAFEPQRSGVQLAVQGE